MAQPHQKAQVTFFSGSPGPLFVQLTERCLLFSPPRGHSEAPPFHRLRSGGAVHPSVGVEVVASSDQPPAAGLPHLVQGAARGTQQPTRAGDGGQRFFGPGASPDPKGMEMIGESWHRISEGFQISAGFYPLQAWAMNCASGIDFGLTLQRNFYPLMLLLP